jgi:phosphatidylglycerophosphate synthase
VAPNGSPGPPPNPRTLSGAIYEKTMGKGRLPPPTRTTRGLRLEPQTQSASETPAAGGRDVPGAKKRDYWWTVLFTDPIAIPLVRLLARRKWLTPDQVSILAIVLGLAVGPLFWWGTTATFIAGGLVFYLAFIVDCVDGKLARALGTTSARGADLDVMGDAARRASASLGLVIGTWRAAGGFETKLWWAVVYVVSAYFFVELSGGSEVRQEAWFKKDATEPRREGRWAAALGRRRLLPTPGMPDVQAIVFILGPVTTVILPALVIGTALVVGGSLINIVRRLR